MNVREAMEASPWVIAGLSEDGTVLAMNAAGRQLAGGEGAGSHFTRLLHPRHRRRFSQAYLRWVVRPRRARVVARTAGHHPHDLELILVPARDDAASAWVFGADVTQRRAREAKLRDSEARYRGFFEHVPVGLYRTSVDGVLLDANPAMVELTGFPDLETLLAHPIDGAYADLEDRRRWRETMARDGVVRGYENRNVRYDGSVFWVRDSGRVIRSATGEPLYYQGTLEDITEQKRAEERARSSEDQLRQAQKLATIGQLAGEIAHDFNNLLTVIQGNLSFGLEDYELDPRLRADLEEIRFAADRATALTRKLLAFSRSQQARPVLFSPAQVTREMGGMLRRILGAQIELRVEVDAGSGEVLADPAQLEQVLLNLVVNARDAMPEGGILEISVARAGRAPIDGDRFVLISVRDTGVGMPPEVRARIFEPFFTTKAPGAGTGLGLSTVMGIVRNAAGAVEVESEPGRGTTFRIYLPVHD